jgi:hypothetical protein
MLRADQGVEFPTGETAAIDLGGSDAVMLVVIFAPEPLSSPPALAEAPGRKLSEKETRELDALLAASVRAPAVKLVHDAPNVATAVSVAADALGRQPVVFELPLRAAPPGPH